MTSPARRPAHALGITMTVPIVALLGLYLVWPVLRALYISLFDYQGLGAPEDFVGLENYARAVADPQLWLGLARNVFYCAFILAVGFVGGTWLAYQLYRRIAGWRVLQVLLFIPHIIPVVVVALLWRFIFQPSLGLMDQLLEALGMTDAGGVWFGDPNKAMVLVAIAWAWTAVPMWTLLLFVSMLNIPSELLESARMDGASERQVLWSIVMPQVRPMLWLLAIMTVLSTFRNFDLVFLLADRVPGNSMTTGAMYVYDQAFEFNNYGYGTAAGFVVAIVIGLMLPFFVRQLGKRTDA